MFVAAVFALDAFLLEAQAEKVAVVLVLEGEHGGLRGLGRDELVFREVGKVRPGTEGVLREKKGEKKKNKNRFTTLNITMMG